LSAATSSVRRLVIESHGAAGAPTASHLAPTPRTPSTREGKPDSDPSAFGDFYTIPSESVLRRWSPSQLQSVPNFVAGQRSLGQIRFLKPVDLTAIDLDELFSRYILFQHSRIDLYPDIYFTASEEEATATNKAIRPPPGQGLNVPAQVRLDRCWPVNRSTRETITDTTNPRFIEHLERLKPQPDLKFIDFIAETGSWIFEIDGL
jgi:nuclear pore complex protein Nup98-Nup96